MNKVRVAKKDDAFCLFLASLLEDSAAMACLRRGLGKPPGHATEMHKFIVPWTDGGGMDDTYYLVASLFALWHQGKTSVPREAPVNFGVSFGKLKDASESIEKRFVAILDSHFDDLPTRLRHGVALLRSKDVPIDWSRLLMHLRNWNAEEKWVQRQWARGFWQQSYRATETTAE